jgi:hypothetical protein
MLTFVEHPLTPLFRHVTDEQRSAISTQLQKRMEDSSDAVRIGILPAIATFFETMPAAYEDEAVSVHTGFLSRNSRHYSSEDVNVVLDGRLGTLDCDIDIQFFTI